MRDEVVALGEAAQAMRRESRGGEAARWDPSDKNDPHNWSLPQLRAYLSSTLGIGKAGGSVLEQSSREELVEKCCKAMGRPYRPPPPTESPHEGSADGTPPPNGRGEAEAVEEAIYLGGARLDASRDGGGGKGDGGGGRDSRAERRRSS
eukprot:1607728-Prymnesium_polylepis.1